MDKLTFDTKTQEFLDKLNDWQDMVCGMLAPEYVEGGPEDMTLTMAYPVHHWEMNPYGAVHGGIIATLFDTTMGVLNHVMTGGLTPTINLNASYLLPAPGDDTLVIRAHITMLGHSVVYTEAKAWAQSAPEKVVATASGVFRNITGKKL